MCNLMTNKKTADMENNRLALESFGTQSQGLILREMFDTLLETRERIKELEQEKTKAQLGRSKGGKARAAKFLARNEEIVLLKCKGMTYRDIASTLREDGENISPDAVRKVCERRSKKYQEKTDG